MTCIFLQNCRVFAEPILIFSIIFFLNDLNKYTKDNNVTQKDAFKNSKCLFHDLVYKPDDNLTIKYLFSARAKLANKFNSCRIDLNFQKVISQNKFRIKLDFDLLSKLTTTSKNRIQCYVHKFDKKINESEQNKKIQIIHPIYYFNSSEIKLSTHGFFYLVCQNKLTNSKIFDQVLTVYPEDMSQLIMDRKNEIIEFRSKYSTFHDHIPFIWYDYEKNGYVTMFQQDHPSISMFNYLKKGFRQWPTDFYGRPFWTKYYATRSGPYKCHFNYPTYFTWFDMMKNFLTAIKNSRTKIPFFSLNYLTEYTHDFFAIPEKMDQHLTDFLKQLVLDDTLFILFTDHGNKLVSYSYKTEMGRLEKFLPFLSIKIPNKMKNSVYYENLKKNKPKLISFFDIYQTLRQFLFLNNHGTTIGYENEFTNNSIKQREKRGMSLFENVHLNRSCDEAYIPEKFCPCLKYTDIDETMLKSETKFDFKMMSEFVLDHVVSKTKMIRSKCKNYKFEKLVQIQKANKINKLLYRIVYMLQPGDAWFESFVNFVDNKFEFNSETVRLSAYENQPFCIDDTILKQFYVKNNFVLILIEEGTIVESSGGDSCDTNEDVEQSEPESILSHEEAEKCFDYLKNYVRQFESCDASDFNKKRYFKILNMKINLTFQSSMDAKLYQEILSDYLLPEFPSPGFKILNIEEEIYAKIATKFLYIENLLH
ncbi:hypothetical protein BpHYR1_050453 [Brachionus plicatilis]|uniref:DUF229 domain containing n=1 Tax=Brachionus plicatilis TaxID=10195 RepID=A0A3M7QG12_BRAPC|nr:hypothetical protein BpHYR1_050453 [Brachionus plicatilis]